MTHVSRRRHVTMLVFASTCGFLCGMVVMAVLLMLFRAGEKGPRPAATTVTPPTAPAHSAPTASAAPDATPPATRADTPAPPARPPNPQTVAAGIDDLRRRALDVPVRGVARERLRSSFDERRDGSRAHEAIDILAPRHTPVVAVESGVIARLYTSRAGGLTIYQFDPTTTYAYYYAHLERYADGLEDGAAIERGQVIGYVGTSGNAPQNTPHLHFGVFVLGAEKRWWEGTPLDPFDALRP